MTTPGDEQPEPGDLDLDAETVKDLEPADADTADVHGGLAYPSFNCQVTATIGCKVASGGC